jgi:hypothetical protein
MGYQVNDNIVILGDLNSDLFIANNNKLIETMMYETETLFGHCKKATEAS